MYRSPRPALYLLSSLLLRHISSNSTLAYRQDTICCLYLVAILQIHVEIYRFRRAGSPNRRVGARARHARYRHNIIVLSPQSRHWPSLAIDGEPGEGDATVLMLRAKLHRDLLLNTDIAQ
jgi:hypothetical protein